MGTYEYIESNLITLRKDVESICTACKRETKSVHIIAVSKTFPAEAVASAIDFNQLDFGENKVQEMVGKQEALGDRFVNWHLIGRLQTNKVKFVVPFVFMIHSVDSLKLAMEIQSRAAKLDRIVKILVQVNTSGEDQKSGCEIQHAMKLVREISVLDNVKVKGLMTISRMMNDDKDENERKIVRSNFRTLKELFEDIKAAAITNTDLKYLSMGMSSDYDIAIEEGSNMIRIGTAIFGTRDHSN